MKLIPKATITTRRGHVIVSQFIIVREIRDKYQIMKSVISGFYRKEIIGKLNKTQANLTSCFLIKIDPMFESYIKKKIRKPQKNRYRQRLK